MITHKEVLEIFQYINGILFYKQQVGSKHIGTRAGWLRKKDGYREVKIANKCYLEHRLIWFYHTGKMPTQYIDHINGVRDDNRIENLRETDAIGNNQNVKKQSNNTSGYIGVTWHKRTKKWNSKIRHKNKCYHLGYFDNPVDAANAYTVAKAKLHTFHPIPITR